MSQTIGGISERVHSLDFDLSLDKGRLDSNKCYGGDLLGGTYFICGVVMSHMQKGSFVSYGSQ